MTSFGINNEGQLVFDYFHSDTDQLEGANVYNGQNSVLWCNFRDAFPDEIKATYQDLRSNGVLNYDELVEQFITKGSDKWSESIYNEDADFKYISMLYEDGDASNLSQVRGTGEEHFRYFVENRLNYCDGKWYAPAYADDYVALRIYTPETWAGVEPNADITVTPFSHMYAGVRYKANGTLYQKRVSANEVTTFEAPDETFNDTETAIYGASQLSSLGDLSPLYCGTINVSKATKLTELIIGSDVEGYSNPNLLDLSVGTNNLLKVLNVRNCPNLTDPLALSGCPNIEEIYAAGSGITGVELADSGYLKVLELPATIANLTLKNQLYIETLTLEGYGAIKTINIENCPTVPSLDILSAATNVERVRLTNVDWTYDTVNEVLALADRNLAGIDENGNNTDKMWIDGKCHIKTLTGAEYLAIKEAFPYMTIAYDNLTAELIFMSEDGTTELTRQTIYNGGNGTDPIDAGTITKPTKDSTAQYHFTYSGWSLTSGGVASADALVKVEMDRTVYVAFAKELRSYTVNFYNGTTLLQRSVVQYGGDAVYSGSTPVNNSTGNSDDFEFYGWEPAPTNIQGDTDCYAQFYDLREITDSWETIAANVANGTATEKYAIGAFKTLNIGEKELPYEFDQGSAVVYDGEIHILGSVISEYRTSHYKWDGTEWVEVGVIPYEFYYGSAVVYNNEIHILGGSSSSSGRTKHYKWNGSTWTSVSTLPYVFEKGVAIVYDNEIHIMGSNNSSNYTSHYKWNGSAWSEVGNLPYSFYTASGFIYNNEIHVLGSYDSNYETAHYKWNGSTWTSVSTLPQKLSNGHALVVGTDIYMIQWDEFYKYDGVSWHACPEVPANVYDGRSVVLDDDIYVMGSSVSKNVRVFYSYAPETSTWSKVGITETIPMEIIAHNHDELANGYKWENLGDLPHMFYRASCVEFNGEIHILGSDYGTHSKKHYKYDGSSWTSVSTLPYSFDYGSAVVYNNEIHILGCSDADTSHYKWTGTEWVSVSTLPYNFYRGVAVVFNNEIHIMGSAHTSYRLVHYKWDGSAWTSVGAPPYGVQDSCAVVLDNAIHILGSYMNGSRAAHYKYDGSAWTEVSTIPYDFYMGSAIVLNNQIHILGTNSTVEGRTNHYKWNGSTWTEEPRLPFGLYDGCALAYNGRITIVGSYEPGYNKKFTQLVGTEWKEYVLPVRLNQPKSCVVGRDIYVCSYEYIYKYDGVNFDLYHTASANVDKLFSYDNKLHFIANSIIYAIDNGNQIEASAMPSWWDYRFSIIGYNSEIHVVGSLGSNNVHYKWDGTEWIHIGTVPYNNCYNSQVIVHDNLLHLFGGYGGGTNHYVWDGTTWTKKNKMPVSIQSGGAICIRDNRIHIKVASRIIVYDNTTDSFIDFELSLPNNMEQGAIISYGNKLHVLGGLGDVYNASKYVYESPKASLTFLSKNLLKDKKAIAQYGHGDGWASASLRTWLNGDFLNILPSELVTAIAEIKKLSDGGPNDPTLKTTEDSVWLLSLSEAGGDDEDTLDYQGTAYNTFTDTSSRLRYTVDADSPGIYWLRSSGISKAGSFFSVSDTGKFTKSSSFSNQYILIGFCI